MNRMLSDPYRYSVSMTYAVGPSFIYEIPEMISSGLVE